MDESRELRLLAERYAGGRITDDEWARALPAAKRKLAWIIQREGDADGERRKPYYIAQLISEAVHVEQMTRFFEMRYEDKKRTARAEAQGNSQKHPHYSMARS